MNHDPKVFLKAVFAGNRKRILIGLGILLAHVLACGVLVMLGGNLNDMIRAHLGM